MSTVFAAVINRNSTLVAVAQYQLVLLYLSWTSAELYVASGHKLKKNKTKTVFFFPIQGCWVHYNEQKKKRENV